MIEKRKSPREKIRHQSHVRILQTDSYLDCTVLDISETGARLGFAGSFTATGPIELHIPAIGQVIQANVVRIDGHEVGVEFSALYDLGETAKALMRFASQPDQ